MHTVNAVQFFRRLLHCRPFTVSATAWTDHVPNCQNKLSLPQVPSNTCTLGRPIYQHSMMSPC